MLLTNLDKKKIKENNVWDAAPYLKFQHPEDECTVMKKDHGLFPLHGESILYQLKLHDYVKN